MFPRVAIKTLPIAVLTAVVLAAMAGADAVQASGASGALVKLRTTAYGRILVDARGHTLYLFEKDKTSKSTCFGKCATFWPPLLTTGHARAGSGVRAALLGTTRRADGHLQVTYNHHPLYLFIKDARAGQTRGQNLDLFGAEWYVMSARGTKVEKKT